MVRKIKQALYFPVAGYFAFWARIQLRVWRPQVILVTGSSGKTTLLHLLEAQIGDEAHYSHKANSAYGLCFDILSTMPKGTGRLEWIGLFLKAPLAAFHKPYPQKLYVAEADSDRPGEAAFVSRLLRPEVVIWLSSDLSHSHNFDTEPEGAESAIAKEFGTFLASAARLVIVNGDSSLITQQLGRTNAKVQRIEENQIAGYKLTSDSTYFKIDGEAHTLPALLPPEVGRSVAAVIKLCTYLDIPLDPNFTHFTQPPGRSSVFAGIKQTTLIDSTYNAIPDAVRAILNLFAHYPAKTKWLVLGDMIEQGAYEQIEHEKLAAEIVKLNPDRIIMVGARLGKYTAPKLLELTGDKLDLVTFTRPKPALEYLQREIQGGETILFKGAGFLEGVVEHLLADPTDSTKLCKRESVWQKRRAQWGL